MTFEEKIKDELIGRGMWPAQANEVFERVKVDPVSGAMRGRWGDAVDGYPPTMFAVIWMGVEVVALAYIDEVMPEAWFRPMFDSAQMKSIETALQKKTV